MDDLDRRKRRQDQRRTPRRLLSSSLPQSMRAARRARGQFASLLPLLEVTELEPTIGARIGSLTQRRKLPFHCECSFTEEHGKTKRVRNFRARGYLPFAKSCGG